MNKLNVFSVRDTKADAFLQPFFLPNESMAVRAISDCVQDDNHSFHKHPEDYSLFHLGEYDEQTGLFDLLDSPVHVTNLICLLEV